MRNTAAARAHLSVDPVMKGLIARHGPCPFKVDTSISPYHKLVRTIIFQQISGAAASTILGRFIALFDSDFPPVQALAVADCAHLRSAGLSRNKALAVIDVAVKTLDKTIPGHAALAKLDDEAIIERLISVRGIGRWTAQMFLMSSMGRPDVLPLNDIGLLNGAHIAYGLAARPTGKTFTALAEKWRPWRSTACWYLWRAADTKL